MLDHAVDDEELVRGLRCIAVPVFDHTGRARYVMSLSAPFVRMIIKELNKYRRASRVFVGSYQNDWATGVVNNKS